MMESNKPLLRAPMTAREWLSISPIYRPIAKSMYVVFKGQKEAEMMSEVLKITGEAVIPDTHYFKHDDDVLMWQDAHPGVRRITPFGKWKCSNSVKREFLLNKKHSVTFDCLLCAIRENGKTL